MKIRNLLLAAIAVTSITGCGTVNIQNNLVTLEKGYFTTTVSKETQLFLDEKSQEYPSLIAAYNQIHGSTPQGFVITRETKVLPEFMLNESLVKKIIDASYGSLIELRELSVDITKNDIESFVSMTVKNYGAESVTKDIASDTDEIIKKYLITYYSDTKDGFIDREGAVYKRPEIKNSIGNDVITAVVQILLEGLFDGILDVPVYTDDKDKFQTEKGVEPTVHKLKFTKAEKLVTDGSSGIDKLELKAIRYLSGLASDQSKTLSGATIRAFGDLEIGFVVGGHFSIGDNDTLSKILDTVFEVSSKRIVEAGAYQGFKKLTWKDRASLVEQQDQSESIRLVQTIDGMENK